MRISTISLIGLLLFINVKLNAQWVPVDAAFAAFTHQWVDSTAVNGNLLDTTNNSVLTLQNMYINYSAGVTDISAVKYFKTLVNLSVSGVVVTTPQLPATLRTYQLSSSALTSFSAPLPDSLTALKLYGAPIAALPVLPHLLQKLVAYSCAQITALPSLPATLTTLEADYCPLLVTVPALPAGLIDLNAAYSTQIVLPAPSALPAGLLYLDASGTQFGPINAWPPVLYSFTCSYCNNVSTLPNAPQSLQSLIADHCPLTYAGKVPGDMDTYDLTATPLDTIFYAPDTIHYRFAIDSMPNLVYVKKDSMTFLGGLYASVCPLLGPWLGHFLGRIKPYPNYGITISANNSNVTYVDSLCTFISYLDLSYNPIQYLPSLHAFSTAFSNDNYVLAHASVNLSHCQLSYLNFDFFYTGYSPYDNLSALNLSYNNFTDISYLPPLTNANNSAYLNLSHNQIDNISITLDANQCDLSYNPLLSCLPYLQDMYQLTSAGTALDCLPNIPEQTFISDMGLQVCVAGNTNNCPVSSVISGKVFNDLNQNSLLDTGEPALPGFNLQMDPVNAIHVSDALGAYSFQCLPFTQYTVSALSTYPYRRATTFPYVTNFASFGLTQTSNQGIYVVPNVNDMQVFLTSVYTNPRPGFSVPYYVTAWNMGTTVENGNIVFNFDPRLVYRSSNPAGIVSGNTISWPVNNLQPIQSFNASLLFDVPLTIPLGSPINAGLWALCNNPDSTIADNHDSINAIAIGSYDPNNKSVSPEAGLTQQQIAAGQYLTYTVRFQNTGTASAINIRVEDALSSYLDISSFQFISSSHVSHWDIDSHILTVYFDNINLPDSGSDETGSHGFFVYRLRPHAGATVGQQIQNTAYIYFDFNPAIITNTTTNAIVTYFSQQPRPQVLCSGESLRLTAAAIGAVAGSQWFLNGHATGIFGDTLLIDSVTTANTGNYYWQITLPGGETSNSDMAGVQVTDRALHRSFAFSVPDTLRLCPDSVLSTINIHITDTVNIDNTATFSWYWNDSLILTGSLNQSFYMNNVRFSNNDRITCYLHLPCTDPDIHATSVIKINAPDTLHVNITPQAPHVCPGMSVLFTANGIGSNRISWYRNGQYINGYYYQQQIDNLHAGDTITVKITPGYNTCAYATANGTDTATAGTGIIIDSTVVPVAPTLNLYNARPFFCSVDAYNDFAVQANNVQGNPCQLRFYWQDLSTGDIYYGSNSCQSGSLSGSYIPYGDTLQVYTTENVCGNVKTVYSNPLVVANDTNRLTAFVIDSGSCGGWGTIGTNADSLPLYNATLSVQINSQPAYSVYSGGSIVFTRSMAHPDTVTVYYTYNSQLCPDNVSLTSNTVILPIPDDKYPYTISSNDSTVCANNYAYITPAYYSDSVTWFVNGQNSNNHQSSYYVPATSDFTVYAVSSGHACHHAATSNTLHVHVVAADTIVYPQIQVMPYAYCTPVFTATVNPPVDGVFSWLHNGHYVTGPVFTPSPNEVFNNGDNMQVDFQIASLCYHSNSRVVDSFKINMVNQQLTVRLDTSLHYICAANSSQTFTVQTTYTGSYPIYQWYKNGNITGNNAPSYTDNTLSIGDKIYCRVTGDNPCAGATTVCTDTLIMQMHGPTYPAVAITASQQTICHGNPLTFTAHTTDAGTAPMYQWRINGVNAGFSSSSFTSSVLTNNDIITCMLTSNAPCAVVPVANSNRDTITVLPAPIADITAHGATTTFCTGDSVKLTASGGLQYHWNSGSSSTYLYAHTGGAYTVTVTGANNCTASATENITVIPLPFVSIVSSGDSLIASPAASYQWYMDNDNAVISTGRVIISQQGHTYHVVVTDGNGCRNRSADFIATGICCKPSDYQTILYPNPNTGEFVLQMSDNISRHVEITDAIGSTVVSDVIVSGTYYFDLNSLASGIYMLHIKASGHIKTMKFSVVH